jgi:uncharacterized membrane protein YgdD (TMEM256/DUF423 family)
VTVKRIDSGPAGEDGQIVAHPALIIWALVTGAVLALLAVMAGAFGAHGLRNLVDARALEVFDTAATYQMYHALGLVLVALLAGFGLSRKLLTVAAAFMLAGVVLFSGSLYALVLVQTRGIGLITPIGGVCFMIGWLLLVVAALTFKADSKRIE